MYDALVLDFAGVLTTPLNASWDMFNHARGLPDGQWRRILHDHPDARAWYHNLEHGRMTQAEWNTRTGRLLGLDDTDDLMGQAHAHVRAATPMVDVARDARAAGLKTALLSNSYGMDPYNPYVRLGVWDLFDVHVISEREGVAKPDPLIYRRTVDRLNVPARACVFVDDRMENLTPAKALGMTVVHATDPEVTARVVRSLLGLERCELTA